jgi:cell division protein ZapA (FtsZ GTPase activity inhibitor)
MKTVTVTTEVPKEMKEVADAVIGLVADIKSKKSVTEIAAAALPRVVTAVDGFEHLGTEAKSEQAVDAYAYLMAGILKALK